MNRINFYSKQPKRKYHPHFTRFRVIDLETTGNPMGSEVVEIGACDLYRGEIILVGSDLVRPSSEIFELGAAVHHITNDDVARCQTLNELLPRYLDQDGTDGVEVYGAHKARFEKKFLGADLPDERTICTYKCSVRLLPKAPAHSNQVLRYWLRLNISPLLANMTHRALPDAYVTAGILRELLKLASVEDLITWSQEPVLLPRVCFGKHKGLAWSELPVDYLDWIVEKSDMNEDVKFTANHYRSRAA
jgi:exodeoxyribonuclease X